MKWTKGREKWKQENENCERKKKQEWKWKNERRNEKCNIKMKLNAWQRAAKWSFENRKNVTVVCWLHQDHRCWIKWWWWCCGRNFFWANGSFWLFSAVFDVFKLMVISDFKPKLYVAFHMFWLLSATFGNPWRFPTNFESFKMVFGKFHRFLMLLAILGCLQVSAVVLGVFCKCVVILGVSNHFWWLLTVLIGLSMAFGTF